MTDQLTQVMQAAERERRVVAARHTMEYAEIYSLGIVSIHDVIPLAMEAQSKDRKVLADFALSILPKGERPVPMEQPEVCDRSKPWSFWVLDVIKQEVFSTTCCCVECIPNGNKRFQCFTTNEDAHIAKRFVVLAEMAASP